MSSNDLLVDRRMTCRYGVRCYQKNPDHLKKYKHPPKPQPKRPQEIQDLNEPEAKRPKTSPKINEDQGCTEEATTSSEPEAAKSKQTQTPQKADKDTAKFSNDISDSDSEMIEEVPEPADNDNEDKKPEAPDAKIESRPYENLKPKDFIKEKFLFEMPEDFYKFWNLCKSINAQNPSAALQEADLLLVGPYDALNGKFAKATKKYTDEEFLLHWRYYYDPPEFQTVLKGTDKTGYHIGYFRDEPEEKPVFMAYNIPKNDGTIIPIGENIFAAVSLYLEEFLKICNPFKKMKINSLHTLIKKEAENLKFPISKKTDRMQQRDHKTVTKSFNKIGLIVPYNRKTQVGYRELYLENKELTKILRKIKEVSDRETQETMCEQLQPLFTYTSIALDECDFGTGVELGWNLLFYGIDCLNKTTARFLRNSYDLLNRNQFALIINAHMENRRKGTMLSILETKRQN